MKKYRPVVLIILDGWGIGPPTRVNAVREAQTPVFNDLAKTFPAATLQASGEAVGLPWQEMGNSEVGHLNLGSGRLILQDLPKINNAIEDGSFFKIPAFLEAIEHVKKNNSRLHLMGLLSSGGVHSYMDHLFALLELVKGEDVKDVFIHAFLDGRDTAPQAGLSYLKILDSQIHTLKIGKVATLCGRFFAMDRDNHWDRVEKAYGMMAQGQGKKIQNFYEEIKSYYAQNIFDENIEPLVIVDKNDKPVGLVQDHDALIFFNYRADRAREITSAFIEDDFKKFERGKQIRDLFFVGMTAYSKNCPSHVAFQEEKIKMTLAETLSRAGLFQMHIAETEKYAHVTYFFDGGYEKPWPGEDYVLIPSPRNKNYAEIPQMSAPEVTKRIIQELKAKKYDFIVVNFANPDMVGHTGNLTATISAVEFMDKCLEQIVNEVLAQRGALIITADHGNAEELLDLKTGTTETKHSSNPVPVILIAEDLKGKGRESALDYIDGSYPLGLISDIAPTVLAFLDIPKPKEMTGINLLEVLLK
ncbi:MAG: 2,3-bisphosphoglycerate-independent phosphoglycerate mutase [Patescibacteria group bacterium]|nr:2,3-bisphosphoglycerate-independent phosphoglycerate mutase [Patescibacteria group bacterium]